MNFRRVVAETNEMDPAQMDLAAYTAQMTPKQKEDVHFGRALQWIYHGGDLPGFMRDIIEVPLEDKKRLMRIAASLNRYQVVELIKDMSPRIDTAEALLHAAAVGSLESLMELWPRQYNTLKAQKAMRVAIFNKKEAVVKRLSQAVNCQTLEEEMTSKGDLDGLKLLYSAIGDVDGAMKIESIQTKDVLSAAVNAELNTGAKQRRM